MSKKNKILKKKKLFFNPNFSQKLTYLNFKKKIFSCGFSKKFFLENTLIKSLTQRQKIFEILMGYHTYFSIFDVRGTFFALF